MAAGNDGGKFPVRRSTSAVHSGRKLFAESFPLSAAPVRFMAAGNCLRKVSPLAVAAVRFMAAGNCLRKVSPLAVAAVRFIAAGNCLRKVSHSPWQQCGSWRQETMGEKFPVRRGTMAAHAGRKGFVTKIPAHGRAGIGDDYFTSWIMGRIMGRRLVRS